MDALRNVLDVCQVVFVVVGFWLLLRRPDRPRELVGVAALRKVIAQDRRIEQLEERVLELEERPGRRPHPYRP